MIDRSPQPYEPPSVEDLETDQPVVTSPGPVIS